MKPDFSAADKQSAREINVYLLEGHIDHGVEMLRALKDQIHASIPARQRISRGVTWVLQRLSQLFISVCTTQPQEIRALADVLFKNLALDDILVGVPIFLMAEYGKSDPTGAMEFFLIVADSKEWVVREFTAIGFRNMIKPCRGVVFLWLKQIVQSDKPNIRRFVSETLRPVTDNKWLNYEPDISLGILRLLFREAHPYPRTSVGNNLSDLARKNPKFILEIVKELVESGDKNSYWIAYRACRNMVKESPEEVMDILGVDEYHYKDRNIYRRGKTAPLSSGYGIL
jgi:3-methyladenine DNA glycosylase AlkC